MEENNVLSSKCQVLEDTLFQGIDKDKTAGLTEEIDMRNIPFTVFSLTSETDDLDDFNINKIEKGFQVVENADSQQSITHTAINALESDHHFGKGKAFKCDIEEKVESIKLACDADHNAEGVIGADFGVALRNSFIDSTPKCTRQTSVIDLKAERKKQAKTFFEDFVDENVHHDGDKTLPEIPLALSKDKLKENESDELTELELAKERQAQNEDICKKQLIDLPDGFLADLAISMRLEYNTRQETWHNKNEHAKQNLVQYDAEFFSVNSKSASGPRKIRELGKGTFGKCFQVEYSSQADGTLHIAVKEMETEGKTHQEKKKMREEYLMLRRLDHHNIVRCFGEVFDHMTDTYCIAMEYMSGGTVGNLLQQFVGGLSDEWVNYYLAQILDGLEYLHSKNILHRDLKGDNLLLSDNLKHLKICDFGGAAMVEDVNGYKDQNLVGTVPFMSPEVIRENFYSAASDVWSVGCCVIQMATGRLPWYAIGNKNETCLLILKIGNAKEPPTIPAHLSSSLYDLTRRCLEIDKEKRITVVEMLNDAMFVI